MTIHYPGMAHSKSTECGPEGLGVGGAGGGEEAAGVGGVLVVVDLVDFGEAFLGGGERIEGLVRWRG